MAKHKFLVAYRDNNGKLIGAQCARCKRIALHVDERVPAHVLAEECQGEDASLVAAASSEKQRKTNSDARYRAI
jgi:hypothetical protein